MPDRSNMQTTLKTGEHGVYLTVSVSLHTSNLPFKVHDYSRHFWIIKGFGKPAKPYFN